MKTINGGAFFVFHLVWVFQGSEGWQHCFFVCSLGVNLGAVDDYGPLRLGRDAQRPIWDPAGCLYRRVPRLRGKPQQRFHKGCIVAVSHLRGSGRWGLLFHLISVFCGSGTLLQQTAGSGQRHHDVWWRDAVRRLRLDPAVDLRSAGTAQCLAVREWAQLSADGVCVNVETNHTTGNDDTARREWARGRRCGSQLHGRPRWK